MMNAITGAPAAHGMMSKQALGSAKIRGMMQDVLLGSVQLYEELRELRRGLEGPTVVSGC